MDTLTAFLLAALSAMEVDSSHYQGPTAKPVVLSNGYLADTSEVAAAKNTHLATLAKSHGYVDTSEYSEGAAGNGDFRYHGPIATPHVLHDGYITDTHEVAAAKAEHFAAVAKAHNHGGEYEGDHSGIYAREHQEYAVPYHGPLAKPIILKYGYLADTHEVAAAKAEHFATVAKAKANDGEEPEGDYIGRYAGEHQGNPAPYHGPFAKPVVLKSGYLADTREVTAAREHHLLALHKTSDNSYYHGYHH